MERRHSNIITTITTTALILGMTMACGHASQDKTVFNPTIVKVEKPKPKTHTELPTIADSQNCRPLRSGEISIRYIRSRIKSCKRHAIFGERRMFFIQVIDEHGKVGEAYVGAEARHDSADQQRVNRCILIILKHDKKYKRPKKFGCYSFTLDL